MIKISNLSKSYIKNEKELPVLRDFNLEMKQGEILALMGPSGSGKTTILNILAGLDTDIEGTVEVSGNKLSEMTRDELNHYRNSRLGFIFQEFNLLPHLNALENVLVPLMFSDVPHGKAREMGMKVLELVRLTEHWNKPPSELSGGQKQRVAVARALVNEPEIILADEPTANLDSESEKAVLDMILDLTRKENATLLISTHRKDIAQLAESIVTLEEIKIGMSQLA
jgi:ABC-type lipoprotein export system ATPase subunit